jgi:hypothetical protein
VTRVWHDRRERPKVWGTFGGCLGVNVSVIVFTGRSSVVFGACGPSIHRGSRMHRPVAFVLAFAVAVLATAWAPSPVAAADDGIPTSATSVYTADPARNQIRVTVTSKLTNRIPSTATTYFYLDRTRIWVEAGATRLKVTSNGGAVKLKLFKKDKYLRAYDVTFPRILVGQTRTITTTYVLPGGKPRSDSTDRVNPAYLNFWAFSQPMDRASVKVIVPKAFDMETYGGTVKQATTSPNPASTGWGSAARTKPASTNRSSSPMTGASWRCRAGPATRPG